MVSEVRCGKDFVHLYGFRRLKLALFFRMMWAAGFLASLGSITYPAISAFVSIHSNVDTQGIFYLFFRLTSDSHSNNLILF